MALRAWSPMLYICRIRWTKDELRDRDRDRERKREREREREERERACGQRGKTHNVLGKKGVYL